MTEPTTQSTVRWTTSTIRRHKKTLRKQLVGVELTGSVIEPVGRHLLRVRVTQPHEDSGRVLLVARDKVTVIP